MKTSLSAVKRIGQMFEIEGTLSRKVGSGRPRASIIKDDHMLKMSPLKKRKKNLLTTANNSKHLRQNLFLIQKNQVNGIFIKKVCKKALVN